jgi:hypothetical protein
MRDQQLPLAVIFSVFASAAVASVLLVMLIRPAEGERQNSE